MRALCKKLMRLAAALLLLISLAGCAGGGTAGGADIDLSEDSANVAYAAIAAMIDDSDAYVGKTVKVSGQLMIDVEPENGKLHYAVIISDAAGCCVRGIEFIPCSADEAARLPQAYDSVTVIGPFEKRMDGYLYSHLENARIE